MILSVDLKSAVPPYEQIRAQITVMAHSGVLPPGTRLPAIRQLAGDLGLAPGTVSRAYRELDTDGVITARGRHGTYIARPPALTAPQRASRLRQAAANYAQAAGQLGASRNETLQALQRALAAHRQTI